MSKWSMRGTKWADTRAQVIDRDGQCVTCGATDDLTADHIIPVSILIPQDNIDAAYDLDNLVTLCRSCNASKGAGAEARPNIVNPKFSDVLDLPDSGWPTSLF